MNEQRICKDKMRQMYLCWCRTNNEDRDLDRTPVEELRRPVFFYRNEQEKVRCMCDVRYRKFKMKFMQ
jgi:hypothetical protein